ncbi:hypothetical protein MLD38_020726 [Melastoma candidum]|uniref:Uncharacterized protein n=1 Tax=Melastoma candidum TaxID=119954 RepID=A0ACB9QES7_9MYRT|nr:hypothetical protein MLD38_020726 [Melastoma candidum]
MGKYMRKPKPTSDLSLVAPPPHSAGVRTRSASAAAAAASVEPGSCGVGASYLQLRSRLLIRRPQGRVAARDGYTGRRRTTKTRRRRTEKGKGGGGLEEGDQEGKKVEEADVGRVGTALSDEASGGDNGLELQGRERTTRESLHNDPDDARTPGSTTKPSNLTQNNRRLRSADCRNIPLTNEMDDFFAGAEEEQQKTFIDKYNFDPVCTRAFRPSTRAAVRTTRGSGPAPLESSGRRRDSSVERCGRDQGGSPLDS